jgi:hypothetical protein
MEIATFLPIATGHFFLHSYWLTAGIWAFPSGFPIPFKQCLAAVQQPSRAFHSRCWLKHGNFHPFFLKGCVSVNIYKRLKEHLKILKTTSSSSPRTDPSNYITFSQSQSQATVPLRPGMLSVL